MTPYTGARAYARTGITAGLSIVVLLAALALGAEWGYGVT